MVATLVSGGFKAIVWGLAASGFIAVVLAGLIAWPVRQPPELASISQARKSVDFSALPVIERFQARDGTELAYRHYPAGSPATGRVAVVIHGSSGSSGTTIHALSGALAAHGVETFAVDIRGHGASGTRGDIAYVGQLEDDLADFIAVVRKTVPTAPLTLVGHSSGGGFALRVAASPIQGLFARTVLLAPYLGYAAPTNRPDSGGWASADIPRILGLLALRAVGIRCCEALPVLAFAVPPNSEKVLVQTYTDRLMRNFANHPDFRRDLAGATRPLTIFSGADDELMLAGNYAEAVRGVKPSVDVKLVAGVNHMGIVSDPAAISIIAADVATAALNS
ncbi:MAG: alpha/beta hydrolase [Bradyrhizobium sp.]|uniref:alpha/beta hydrolase n=1 Tax=Bradyrhizobium sp. TaxID=376 RepID=UPI001216E312|nr:alpha/beta hydrolase [Bradyrhizobium sp.]THD66047.1 MAG: alpha/beta hydrolase [Bradyrhizobium sp.]